MKKLTLAALLAFATSTAFAGFNGNTNGQGGFQQGATHETSVIGKR